MANGKIRFGKQSGGELALVIPNGVANTEVVVPESGILATEQYVDSKYSGFKNYIINGKFDIWQRGSSFNIAGGEARCTDMFLAYSTATTPTASRDSGTSGFYNSLKISGANSISNKHIIHRIEAVNTISFGVNGNTKITFSLWLKADVNSTVRVAIRVPNTTDTWGSYTTPKTSNDIHITTSWERYSVTFDLDFVYWGGIALDVTTSTAQTSLWTTGWQLEQGSVATPFENRPYGLELSLCQRYYETSYVYQNGVYYVGTQGLNSITWVCPKRVMPSVTFSNVLYSNSNSLLVNETSKSSLITQMISTDVLNSVKYVVEASAEL